MSSSSASRALSQASAPRLLTGISTFLFFRRRASAGAGREQSDIPAVLLHGHENRRARVGNVRRRSSSHMYGFHLLEKKYGHTIQVNNKVKPYINSGAEIFIGNEE